MGEDHSVGKAESTAQRARTPRWARLCAIFGAVLMVGSGGMLVASQALTARYAGAVKTQSLFVPDAAEATTKKEPVSDIKGPVNLLLVGIDPRDDSTAPLSDSIIVVHVPKNLNEAYLFSIPRDLIVDIPAYDPPGYPGAPAYAGGRGKINGAMANGSSVGNGKHDVGKGFGLLAKTVSQLTGIKQFNAGAIINFNGFKNIVDAMGGVTMYIDERTRSEHRQPDGKPRPRDANCGCEHPYYGPYKVYEKGVQHLEGWEALDFVRQRYGLKGTDYARQRHQQQFIKALAAQALSKDVATNPVKIDKVLRAAGESLIFDGKGYNVVEWGLALKGIRPDAITMIKLPGGGVGVGSNYKGEALDESAQEFFASLTDGTIADFMIQHPEYLNRVQ
ncbi:MAG TPA: LCP family protein [Actinoplanes sp.]|jgi:anionic cell wall polymer biosynthesis LytR-Cps2A-Psr (LCP) family protein